MQVCSKNKRKTEKENDQNEKIGERGEGETKNEQQRKSMRWPCSSSDEIFPLTLAHCVLKISVISKGTVQIF